MQRRASCSASHSKCNASLAPHAYQVERRAKRSHASQSVLQEEPYSAPRRASCSSHVGVCSAMPAMQGVTQYRAVPRSAPCKVSYKEFTKRDTEVQRRAPCRVPYGESRNVPRRAPCGKSCSCFVGRYSQST